MAFKALLATKRGEKITTALVELEEKDLMSGDVRVAVDYSTANYTDEVALTGRAPIIQTFPLIPDIDLSGTVEGMPWLSERQATPRCCLCWLSNMAALLPTVAISSPDSNTSFSRSPPGKTLSEIRITQRNPRPDVLSGVSYQNTTDQRGEQS